MICMCYKLDHVAFEETATKTMTTTASCAYKQLINCKKKKKNKESIYILRTLHVSNIATATSESGISISDYKKAKEFERNKHSATC